jgi:ankyrin repeat protein
MFKKLAVLFCFSANLHAQSVFDLARSGTAEKMQIYLKKHPEHINLISEHGSSPFLLAAYRGNNEVANLLIEKGADLTYCYGEGSAIYALIYKNNIQLLEAILKKGVNVNDTCQFQQFGYPIHFALTLQRYDAISLLLKYNAKLNITDQQERTIEQLLILYNDPKYDEIFHEIER